MTEKKSLGYSLNLDDRLEHVMKVDRRYCVVLKLLQGSRRAIFQDTKQRYLRGLPADPVNLWRNGNCENSCHKCSKLSKYLVNLTAN